VVDGSSTLEDVSTMVVVSSTAAVLVVVDSTPTAVAIVVVEVVDAFVVHVFTTVDS